MWNKFALILCFQILFSASGFAKEQPLRCLASHMQLGSSNSLVNEVVDMQIESQSGAHILFSVHLSDRSFFAVFFRDSEELLLQIIHQNDETKGIVTRGGFDNKGQISMSEVSGETVYRLQCLRP